MVARLPRAAADDRPTSDDSSLSLGYGQWTASLKGRETLLVFLLALLVCGQFWCSWQLLRHMDEQHTALLAESQMQTWMLSRPEAERPKLAMPPTLRARLQ